MRKPPLGGPEGLDALLIRIAAGDRIALRAVYRIAGPRLYAMLVAVNANEGVADDLLEDIFVAIWREAESFDPQQETAWQWLRDRLAKRLARTLN